MTYFDMDGNFRKLRVAYIETTLIVLSVKRLSELSRQVALHWSKRVKTPDSQWYHLH